MKFLFIGEGSDQPLISSQWKTAKAWERAHVIVFEEVRPDI